MQPSAPAPAAEPQPAATPVRGALGILAAEVPASWTQLHAAMPGQFDPATDPQGYEVAEFTRLTLAGFEDQALPDGGAGADAGTRVGNEGDSGVTFGGDAQSVYSMTVRKFRSSADAAAVIRDQLLADDRLVDAAGECVDQPLAPGESREYWLQLDGAAVPLLMTATLVDAGKSGPGYTDFAFMRGNAGTTVADCTP